MVKHVITWDSVWQAAVALHALVHACELSLDVFG